MHNFKAAADEVLSKKIGDTITRENINPAFKYTFIKLEVIVTIICTRVSSILA